MKVTKKEASKQSKKIAAMIEEEGSRAIEMQNLINQLEQQKLNFIRKMYKLRHYHNAYIDITLKD